MWKRARYLVGVLVAVLWTSACGDSSTFAVGDEEAPDSVIVSPETGRLEEIGASREFTVVAYEGDQPLSDPDVTWISTDFSVATVSSAGVAVAQGAGQTFIVATVAEVADSATLSVDFVSQPGS